MKTQKRISFQDLAKYDDWHAIKTRVANLGGTASETNTGYEQIVEIQASCDGFAVSIDHVSQDGSWPLDDKTMEDIETILSILERRKGKCTIIDDKTKP